MNLIDRDNIPWMVDGVGEIPVITKEEVYDMPTVDAIPVEHVKKMIESVKSLPNSDYFLKYFAVNVMDALILGWRAE